MTNRARASRAAGKTLWFLQMSQNPTYIHICIALPFLNLAFTIWRFYNVTKNLWTPSTLFLVIITTESRLYLASPTISSTGFLVCLIPHKPRASFFPKYFTTNSWKAAFKIGI